MCLAGDPDDRPHLALHGTPRQASVCSELAPGQVSVPAVAWRNRSVTTFSSFPKLCDSTLHGTSKESYSYVYFMNALLSRMHSGHVREKLG